jgi:hypothetical protein
VLEAVAQRSVVRTFSPAGPVIPAGDNILATITIPGSSVPPYIGLWQEERTRRPVGAQGRQGIARINNWNDHAWIVQTLPYREKHLSTDPMRAGLGITITEFLYDRHSDPIGASSRAT